MRKRRPLKPGVLLVLPVLLPVLLATAHALAAPPGVNQFPQPVPAGSLPGRTVLQPLESQPVLGTVRGAVRLPEGGIAIVVDHGGLLARFGGVFGIGSRPVAVPIDAMALLSPQLEVVGLTPAQLDALPTYAGDGAPLDPAETVRIGLIKPSH